MQIRLCVLSCLALAGSAQAQSEPVEPVTNVTARQRNMAVVAQFDAANRAAATNRADRMVRPGLTADRTARQVTFLAEATGLEPGTPTEFFFIGQNSGHDYESLAVAFAKPGDVHEALTFIGLTPGRGVDPGAMCFWPKGERVIATVRPVGATGMPTRVETYLVNSRTGQGLREAGFVFVGSRRIEDPDRAGDALYAADVREPNSIVSAYNEPDTVLDVPRIAPQGSVYREQTPNPERLLPAGELLEVVLEPEYPDGRKRLIDLRLAVSAPAQAQRMKLAQLRFDLTDDKGMSLGKAMTLEKLLEAFSALTSQGRDPFVAIDVAETVQMGALHSLAAVLASIETENGIRVEPPPEGQLYYKAFLPNEALRTRPARIVQPRELHLKRQGGGPAVLTHIEQKWQQDSLEPELEITHIPVADPEVLRRELERLNGKLPVILVFVDPELPYRRLREFVMPLRATHPIVHVYLEKEPAPALPQAAAEPPAPETGE